ncbi:hypothetical protein EVJ24_14935 [Exiguobacterium sp. SH1S21]|uniref:hypothetical protein n=1 Tax=Exiguobacterium sp. SH1S21 TaxID=2510953 RepID=UPI00103F8B4C|nr:hypothetical protein [Exiguobacterium sp. SH1S21]TCI50334.1 hypothetical protein EVJ24_14935 [Exiguobacterium sp. SH1S21]
MSRMKKTVRGVTDSESENLWKHRRSLLEENGIRSLKALKKRLYSFMLEEGQRQGDDLENYEANVIAAYKAYIDDVLLKGEEEWITRNEV